jgi:hypothetical protein
MTGSGIFLGIYALQAPLDRGGDEDGLEMLLFHLDSPGRRPTARRAGGRVGAHPPPHPSRRKRISRERRVRAAQTH